MTAVAHGRTRSPVVERKWSNRARTHLADQSTVLRGAKLSRREGHAWARGKTRTKHKVAHAREGKIPAQTVKTKCTQNRTQ